MSWYFSALPLFCLATAVLELDNVHAGQWLLSRPFVVGSALGLALGNAWTGIRMGIVLELLTIDDLPVGNALPLNATIATAMAVLLSSGPAAVSPAVSLPAGLCAGALFRYVEGAVRAFRNRLTMEAEAALEAGRRIPFGAILSKGMIWHSAAAAGFLYGGTAILAAPLAWAGAEMPGALQYGLNAAFELAPWLGFATLLRALRRIG